MGPTYEAKYVDIQQLEPVLAMLLSLDCNMQAYNLIVVLVKWLYE